MSQGSKNSKDKSLLGVFNLPIFILMLVLVVVIIAAGSINPESFGEATGKMTSFVVDNFGWWLTLCMGIFVIFAFVIGFTKFGNIKLGKDDDKPEYSFFTWFAMLFSCGLGVALYFWGVGEPISHFMSPPYMAEAQTIEAASLALQITNIHYGITMWAVFGIAGLVIAYFAFRKDQPLTVSNGLYGLLGDKAYGKVGNVVDFLTVFATVGGVSTSVGLGVMQLRYGVNWLTGVEATDVMVAGIFIVLLVLYTITAASGVNKGIKHLSNINMYIAFGLLAFVFITGPRIFELELMVQSTAEMFANAPEIISFLDPGKQTGGWTKGWSVFYWCWHLSWAPFVGGFVARISKGRTIKEFIIGVLGAPLLFTIVWFGVFGGSAIFFQMEGVDIAGSMAADTSAGIFTLFEQLPLSALLGVVLFVNLLTFLATSANSAALFSAIIVSKGNQNPKPAMIVVWALAIGLVGLILMLSGGLGALQSAAVASGSIFSVVLVLMIISFVKSLNKEDK